MSATTPSHSLTHNNLRPRPTRKRGVNSAVVTLRVNSPSVPTKIASSSSFLLGDVLLPHRRRSHHSDLDGWSSRGTRFRPVMEWQDCTVKMEVGTPVSIAYNFYSDRRSIPRWMTFISSVKVLEDKPDLSRWSLKYNAFGIDIEYSWLAQNMQSIPDQKIHWRSLEGLPNRGIVRFYPKGPSSCIIEWLPGYVILSEEHLKGLEISVGILENQVVISEMCTRNITGMPIISDIRTVGAICAQGDFFGQGKQLMRNIMGMPLPLQLTTSYEVPQLLVPVTSALQPFMEGLLRRCLERFATLVESKST